MGGGGLIAQRHDHQCFFVCFYAGAKHPNVLQFGKDYVCQNTLEKTGGAMQRQSQYWAQYIHEGFEDTTGIIGIIQP